MNIKNILTGSALAGVAVIASLSTAYAATTIVVTPANQQGWDEADTRPGGDVNFVSDTTAPLGDGALQLKTDATTAAKAQYLHSANTLLADVTGLSYSTKQVTASFAGGAPSYQLVVDLNGSATGGFTTLVYEPYQNGVVAPTVWQSWDVDAGQFWSSRTFTEGTCSVVAGAGGPPFYSLAGLQAICPDAVVQGFGVNVGTFNPSYDVYTDGVTFNGTTYDFEQFIVASNKEQCKNEGYKDVTDANGNPFKNQGQCVSSFAPGQNK